MKQRVIVWGTGFVGKMVIRELVGHPAFELAGVIVNDEAKDGRDAGEIAGIGEIGIRATRDPQAAFAQGVGPVFMTISASMWDLAGYEPP